MATALLEDLAGRGVASSRRRLFVIDGASALRKAVDLVFGVGTPVQRCRNHKLRNVLGHLPQAQHDQPLDAQGGVQARRQGGDGPAPEVRDVAGAGLAQRGGLA